FKNAAAKANVVLLEPILEVEVIVPEEFMGDVIGDLNARRGKILGMERVGKYQKIKAYVPEAEMYKYSTTLRSLTQGKGTFTQRFAFYEEVPKEIADRIVEERRKEMEEENK
ncbi:elongation factor G, partial [bacterium]